MASKTILFKDSSYFKAHHGVDEGLVNNVLIPELKKQGPLGLGAKGIELPIGDEFISLAEAKELVVNYLIYEINLPERDQNLLRTTKGYAGFSDLAKSFINREITEPETLATSITPDKLESLQRSKDSVRVNDRAKFSSDQTIRDYNELFLKIKRISTSGNSAQILARLYPHGLSGVDIHELALTQAIVANLNRLNQATYLSKDPEVQNYAVAQEFSKIINNYPELAGYRNYLGDDTTRSYLTQYVNSIVETATHDDSQILEKLVKTQRAYGQKLKQYLPNESELRTQIYNTLPLVRDNERATLTDQILRASTKNSLNPVEIDKAIEDLKLNKDLEVKIIQSFHENGIDIALKYNQDKIRFLAQSHYLTGGEKKLLKRGINPFLVTQDPHGDLLVNREKDILSAYNAKSIQIDKPFTTLREAYEHESQKDNPDPIFLIHARDLLNRQSYYSTLSPREKAQVGSTRLGRTYTNFTSRLSDIQDKLTDRVFDLTDTITGKKWFHKQLDKIESWTANVTVPSTKIPLFRLSDWVAGQFEGWKKTKILNLVSSSASWTSPLGKFAHARLKDYKLGGFTFKGMTTIGLHRAWSRMAYKATAGIVKQGSIASFRTATRFFLKVGAKSLAKVTFKLGNLAVSGALSLSGVLSALGIVLLIKDVIEIGVGVVKWGWEQLKKIFPTTEGAAAAAITAIITYPLVVLSAGTTFVLGLLGPLVLPAIITATMIFSITFGGLYLFTYLGGGNFNTSIHLDSGVALFTAIFCDQDQEGEGSSDPVLNCATCLVDYLTACYGPSVTGASISTTGIGCLIARTVAPEVASIIEASATRFTYLQCVGFVQASYACGGKSLDGMNACSYEGHSSFRSGLSGAKPGDAIVFRSSGSCSDGAPGHIGILKEDAGALVCLVDANSTCSGCVSANNCLPKTNVAGHLRL